MAKSGFFCARPRLHARLDDGASRRLTTVVAGPGFGKSTLVADWVADRAYAWITVHPGGSSLPAFASGL
ncbi:MAG: hypothetical protein M3450_00985, partial [Actinomycetota bacterium]|nr:hypothetical protein [Actinomycetota bacterium]